MLLDEDCLQCLSHLWWEQSWPTRGALHVDMDEVSLSCSILLIVPEKPDLVANTPVAEPDHPQASVYCIWEGNWFEESALCFDNQADDRTILDVQGPLIDQITVDDCIEVRVIDDVVNMTVHVVIHPACWNHQKMRILIPPVRGWLVHESLQGVGWVAPKDYMIMKSFLPVLSLGDS